jgi:hypothetical protein
MSDLWQTLKPWLVMGLVILAPGIGAVLGLIALSAIW